MSWIKRIPKLFFIYLLSPLSMLVMLLGGALLIVASPLVWPIMYDAPEALGEFAQIDGELIASHLWTDKSYREVSRELQGGRLLHREVVHYEDLQEKFRELKQLTVVCVLLSFGVFFCRDRRKAVIASLVWLFVICIVGGIWSYHDWRGLFRQLHWWIFQDDSWILPWGCYSLKLYPYYVWKSAMVWMVVISVVGYAVLWGIATLLNKRELTK